MVEVTEMGRNLRGERSPVPLGIRYKSESPKERGAVGESDITSRVRAV